MTGLLDPTAGLVVPSSGLEVGDVRLVDPSSGQGASDVGLVDPLTRPLDEPVRLVDPSSGQEGTDVRLVDPSSGQEASDAGLVDPSSGQEATDVRLVDPSRRALARFVLLATLLVACHPHAHAGPHLASRVVSLSPSTTEALAAIGARGALIGRSRYCDYPPDVLPLPEVGGYVDPSYEAILALAPDLVTGARGPSGPDLATRLTARGIDTYFPVTESFDGIDAMIRGLGERTAHTTEAEAVVTRLHAEETSIRAAVAGRPPVRALLLFGVSPIVAAGPGGFADEMLRRAGGANVVTEGGAYPTLGLEHVMALDPDVIVDAAWGEPADQGRISTDTPGWRELRAVKAGRVVSLKDEVVLRPGPRIGEGLRMLTKALHPEARLP